MAAVRKMSEVDLSGKRVLLREDLNVPVKNGQVTNDTRLRASLPSIEMALKAGARVLVMSHLGRPSEGKFEEKYSLKPVAEHLARLLGRPVALARDWLDGVAVPPGEVVLCENVRFNVGEEKNDEALGRKMAALCDVYVMDAFATAHRAQASTHAVARFAPVACAGPLLAAELEALGRAVEHPARPLLAIVGGAKVSTKLTILDTLARQVDELIVGGGIANNFLDAAGYNVGKSLYEPDLVAEAKRIMDAVKVPLPVDVVCGREVSESARAVLKNVSEVAGEDMILDIGPATSARYAEAVKKAGTVIWNGPVGVFEHDQFAHGTKSLAQAIAESKAFTLAGGGETVAALDKFGLTGRISYVSTAGGAFLEFLEGRELPAVAVLAERAGK